MEIHKLTEWAARLEAESQSIRDQIQSLNADLQKKAQQAELIRRLIDSASEPIPPAKAKAQDSGGRPAAAPLCTPSQVKDHVYSILSDAKCPMNINEIHSEFLRRGYIIPGKGTAFNILVHIGRELKLGKKARFYRAGRGTYALSDHQPNERP